MDRLLVMIGVAVFAGGAVALLVFGLRRWMLDRFWRDVQWMRDTYLRFHPDPINAELYTFFYYGAFAGMLLLLLTLLPNPYIAVAFWVVVVFLTRIYIEWG